MGQSQPLLPDRVIIAACVGIDSLVGGDYALPKGASAMASQARTHMDLLIFGPDDASTWAVANALHAHHGQTVPAPAAPLEERIPLPSSADMYTLEGTTISQFVLPAAIYPDELTAQLGRDACHLLVLPLASHAPLPDAARFVAFLYVLRILRAQSLAIFVDVGAAALDDELCSVAMLELEEQLALAGWSEDQIAIICGDAQALLVEESDDGERSLSLVSDWLLRMARQTLSLPKDKPFLMHTEDRFNMAGHQTVVTGRISQGEVHVGDYLVLLHHSIVTRRVGGIEIFRRILSSASAGDNVGLLLDHTALDDVKRGDILTKAPESFERVQSSRAYIHFRSTERGGLDRAIPPGAALRLYLATTDYPAALELDDESPWRWEQRMEPGHTIIARLTFAQPVWCESGALFAIRWQGKGIGHGVLLPPQEAASGEP